MVIQHNIPALNSHRNLGINNKNTSSNLEKLSSGYRINRAGDDAAGLAISEKMRGQISGLGMAEQNANNGISLIQTAEGGLNETHSILQRMRELAVQSSNGTYQDSDRAQIELEYQALKSEMDRIASYTNYNGIKLLDGTIGGARLELTKSPGTALTGDAAQQMGFVAGNATLSFGTTGTVDVITPAAALSGSATTIATALNGAATMNGASATYTYTNGAWTTTTSANGDAGGHATALAALKGNTTFGDGKIEEGATLDITWGTGGAASVASSSGNIAETTTPTLAAGGTSDLSLVWNGTDWDATGYVTLTENADGTGAAKRYSVSGSGGVAGDLELTLVDEKGVDTDAKITIAAAQLIDPNKNTTTDPGYIAGVDTDLVANSSYMRLSVAADGAITVTKAEGYRNDPEAKPLTADQVRINDMLDSMGIDQASKFHLSADYFEATGLTADDAAARAALFSQLNGKDAYIITRASVADTTQRNVFDADSGYETILQVGDKTFIGTLNSDTNSVDFKMTDPQNPQGSDVTIASLSLAGVASESGSIRFNIGNVLGPGVSKLTNELSSPNPGNKHYTQTLVDKENAIIGSENTANLVFQVGANGAEDQRIGLYVFNMSSNNLGNHEKGNFVSESTIITRDEANIAVETLDSAINYVSAQRAQLGALQNRLEHTLNNLGVTKENLTAAESSIRDVDMAKEMMNFTKNNILLQASQAMLAQANSLPQGVLSLLR